MKVAQDGSEPLSFPPCPDPTLGIELEVWIVDPQTGRLAPAAAEILGDAGLREHAKHELFQSIVEVTTPVCRTVQEATAAVWERLGTLQAAAKTRGLGLMAAGTAPAGDWRAVPITPEARYLGLAERLQWPAKRLLICGTHLHVGVKSGEHAIAILNTLVVFIPHFIALSASSPFWMGHDTGLASARIKVFEALPTTGLPPRIVNWSQFVQLMRTLRAAGAIESVREIWWDVRPHPFFGTLELRVCDAVSRRDDLAAIAAFGQSLIAYFQDLYDRGEPLPSLRDWTIKENKWRAVRHGQQAMLIRNERGEQVRLADHIGEWVDKLGPTAERLGCGEELRGALEVLRRGPSHMRQRAEFARSQSVGAVTQSLLAELR